MPTFLLCNQKSSREFCGNLQALLAAFPAEMEPGGLIAPCGESGVLAVLAPILDTMAVVRYRGTEVSEP